jgi:hypothetical protein
LQDLKKSNRERTKHLKDSIQHLKLILQQNENQQVKEETNLLRIDLKDGKGVIVTKLYVL